MIFGVDYYPEHWNRDEWESQAKLMQKGGFNTVRMGEFAWKLFEKKEGEFDTCKIRYKNHTRNTDCRTAEVACG